MKDSCTDPEWLRLALFEHGPIGQARIVAFLEAAPQRPTIHTDITPWGGAFVCWVLEAASVHSPRCSTAQSFLTWGSPLALPRIGAIAVLAWSCGWNAPNEHVGLYLGEACDHVLVLGGNTPYAVTIQPYPAGRVIGLRWPDHP